MKLADYLTLSQISAKDFARQIGVSKQTVYNYTAHPSKPNHVKPHIKHMTKIVKLTNGQVQVSDFYPNLNWHNNEKS